MLDPTGVEHVRRVLDDVPSKLFSLTSQGEHSSTRPAAFSERSRKRKEQVELQSNCSPRTPKHRPKSGSNRRQRARRINNIERTLRNLQNLPGSNPGGASNHKSLKPQHLQFGCFWSNFCPECVLARSFEVEVQKTSASSIPPRHPRISAAACRGRRRWWGARRVNPHKR